MFVDVIGFGGNSIISAEVGPGINYMGMLGPSRWGGNKLQILRD
jgi:hypothetical protein